MKGENAVVCSWGFAQDAPLASASFGYATPSLASWQRAMLVGRQAVSFRTYLLKMHHPKRERSGETTVKSMEARVSGRIAHKACDAAVARSGLDSAEDS